MKRKIFAIIFMLILLLWGVIFFRYLFLYNKANRLYQRKDYVAAIEIYEDALHALPPRYKECSIRINLALAMIYNLGDNYAAPDQVENSINTLLKAREILLEDDCATQEGDGHSETAERLKDEIDRLLEELQPPEPQDPNNPSNEDTPETPPASPLNEEEENQLQQQLQEIQNNAYQEREEGIQSANELNMDINFNFDGHGNW